MWNIKKNTKIKVFFRNAKSLEATVVYNSIIIK